MGISSGFPENPCRRSCKIENTGKLRKLAPREIEKLNRARGPTAIVIPLIGWIEGDRHPKSPFHDSEGGRAFSQALKSKLKPEVKVIEVDAHINDPLFSETILRLFDEIVA